MQIQVMCKYYIKDLYKGLEHLYICSARGRLEPIFPRYRGTTILCNLKNHTTGTDSNRVSQQTWSLVSAPEPSALAELSGFGFHRPGSASTTPWPREHSPCSDPMSHSLLLDFSQSWILSLEHKNPAWYAGHRFFLGSCASETNAE